MTDELRKLAEAALEPHDAWYGLNELSVAMSGHAASFIAAASPSAVLALLDRIEELESALQNQQDEFIAATRDMVTMADRVEAERDEARAAVKRLAEALDHTSKNLTTIHAVHRVLDDPVVQRIVEGG